MKLRDKVGKPLVVYFYPKDETYGCTKEACSFRDSHEDFVEAGAEVIGISRDSAMARSSKRNARLVCLNRHATMSAWPIAGAC